MASPDDFLSWCTDHRAKLLADLAALEAAMVRGRGDEAGWFVVTPPDIERVKKNIADIETIIARAHAD
jgi:ribosomal protein L29